VGLFPWYPLKAQEESPLFRTSSRWSVSLRRPFSDPVVRVFFFYCPRFHPFFPRNGDKQVFSWTTARSLDSPTAPAKPFPFPYVPFGTSSSRPGSLARRF